MTRQQLAFPKDSHRGRTGAAHRALQQGYAVKLGATKRTDGTTARARLRLKLAEARA